MDHQDWNPVVLQGNKSRNNKSRNNKKILGSKSYNKSNTTKNKYKEDVDGKPIKKTLPKDFGQKMQIARADKGWTQKELAQKMNCKPSEIQSYEQNKTENPNKSFARKIERILGSKLF